MEKQRIDWIKSELERLEEKMLLTTQQRSTLLHDLHPSQIPAAKNMIHYLTLRSEDIRELQDALHLNGLSSLASSESNIHRQVQAVQNVLGRNYTPGQIENCSFEWSRQSVSKKCTSLFGSKTNGSGPHIMVTFDSAFADNYTLIKNLVQNGMNVARINCAHDDESVWSKMIYNIHQANKQLGTDCRIYMDLAGPKNRIKLLNKGKEEGKVKIKEGSLIWLSEKDTGFKKEDIVISLYEKGIIDGLRKGERVYFDDGIIKGVVETSETGRVGVRIVRISSQKRRIKVDKGINFPDSKLNIQSLTDYDLTCLPFLCRNADIIGYSFVRNSSDVERLQVELQKHSENPPHIIIKIETLEAVNNLPYLLLAGMKREFFGVMIARGDLAVEVGFERMGEIQEEILWICESAHVPVIWATQVLETLNKSGVATRSEITDAVHSAKAECVMVNKGSHTIKAMETLLDIFKRSGGHHSKKRFTFRSLSIASNFVNLG
jgi:pyruvate kinase